jgi:recyclin-1
VYQQHVSLLLPFYTSLQTQSTSSLVFTTTTFTSAPSSGPITMTPLLRARLLASLNRFCHPLVAPTRSRTQRLLVARNVQSAIDFYESTLLAEFERADAAAGPGGRDEATMKDKANVLWELNQSTTLSQVFVQKRETLFSGSGSGSALGGGGGGGGGGSHDPLKNLT